jgi:hypothetical protein
MCLNETYSKICVGKHLSDNFRIQDGLKEGDAFHLCFPHAYLQHLSQVFGKNWIGQSGAIP